MNLFLYVSRCLSMRAGAVFAPSWFWFPYFRFSFSTDRSETMKCVTSL